VNFDTLKKYPARFDNRLFWFTASVGIRILLLAKNSIMLRLYLGYAYEHLGKMSKASRTYQSLYDSLQSSQDIKMFRWLHVVRFVLERSYHLLGNARVEDPLFLCQVTPAGTLPVSQTAGYYTIEFSYAGMKIFGFAAEADAEWVEILIDGIVLRKLNTGKGKRNREFSITLQRDTIQYFPTSFSLELRTPRGNMLRAFGKHRTVNITLPHGNGEIFSMLETGKTVDKKGFIIPTDDEVSMKQNAFLDVYDDARDFFEKELGTSLFLMYGTLLGLYRQGDFIKGDDDFDVGYMSEATNTEEVKAEAIQIVKKLLSAGFSVSFNRRGRLFRLHGRNHAKREIHLDVRPIWVENGRVWAHNHFTMEGDASDFTPVEERELRGVKVYIPHETEKFLLSHYGPGWKVPDPGFMYYLSAIDPSVLGHLGKALITPKEYKVLKGEVVEMQKNNAKTGLLTAIGAESLYPLRGLERE
jgi:hypothetical protein